jgi:hypothetical protein
MNIEVVAQPPPAVQFSGSNHFHAARVLARSWLFIKKMHVLPDFWLPFQTFSKRRFFQQKFKEFLARG